jgi:ferritin-like metal-binding protein YciE
MTNQKPGDLEFIELARNLRAEPAGEVTHRRTDAPLRSAYSDAYRRELGEAQHSTGSPNLSDLFLSTLRKVYFAEKQIAKFLPKLAKAATDDVRTYFEQMSHEAADHLRRLDDVFGACGVPSRGRSSDPILGIIEEGKSILEEFAQSEALNAGLMATTRAVTHYRIARYRSLAIWADQLDLPAVSELLHKCLSVEETRAEWEAQAIGEDPRAAAVA